MSTIGARSREYPSDQYNITNDYDDDDDDDDDNAVGADEDLDQQTQDVLGKKRKKPNNFLSLAPLYQLFFATTPMLNVKIIFPYR